jgi:acetolactate synthase-1/2/3 large subunit
VANEVLADCDVVLALGTRLGGLATSGWQLPFDEKRIVQVDHDPQVLGHNYPAFASLVADIRLALTAALAEIDRRGTTVAHESWTVSVGNRVRAWQVAATGLLEERPLDGMHPAVVLDELRSLMDPRDLLVADTGGIAAWAATLFPVPAGHTFVRSTGSLGWALPGALGATLADSSRRTVALIGDGGLLYHIGELETAVRLQIPTVIVVLNNLAFASERHLLTHGWQREIPEITDFHDIDLASIATGFGVAGFRVDDPSDVGETLRAAFAHGGPALVDARISRDTEAPAVQFRGDHPV